MGSVYRAEPLEGGAALALKLVNLETTPDGRAARRFEREAESGLRIKSPHVVRTLASGRLGENLGWLALEFAEGVSFDELLRERGVLPLERARHVLAQLYAALSAAHAEGIVHRDLKPENVRVAGEADALVLKVLDFGIAKDFGVSTLSGTTPGLGTPLWTAPEQSRAGYQPVSNADVWSLGLLTFFTLTGKQYWLHARERGSMADLALELLRGDLPPASDRAQELDSGVELPAGFDQWFARAVNRDPTQRFRDASAAWQTLDPLLRRHATNEPDKVGEVGLGPHRQRDAPHRQRDAPHRPTRSERAELEEVGLGPHRPTRLTVPGVFLTALIASVVVAGLVIYWLLRSMHI
jgi:eukaryotic-like serine/threonine-protein kinase